MSREKHKIAVVDSQQLRSNECMLFHSTHGLCLQLIAAVALRCRDSWSSITPLTGDGMRLAWIQLHRLDAEEDGLNEGWREWVRCAEYHSTIYRNNSAELANDAFHFLQRGIRNTWATLKPHRNYNARKRRRQWKEFSNGHNERNRNFVCAKTHS